MELGNIGTHRHEDFFGLGDHVGIVAVGDQPSAIAAGDFTEDGLDELAVTNFGDDTVSVVDVRRAGVVRTVDVGTGPSGVTVARSKVYVSNRTPKSCFSPLPANAVE